MSVLVPVVLRCDNPGCSCGERGQPKLEQVVARRRATERGSFLDVQRPPPWRRVSEGVDACSDGCHAAIIEIQAKRGQLA